MKGASPPNSITARFYISDAPVERTPTGKIMNAGIGPANGPRKTATIYNCQRFVVVG